MPASVLLIEDEALIRMMLVEMIEEAGHSVVAEAGDVKMGTVLATHADSDLAILDIILGGDTIEPIASQIAGRGKPIGLTLAAAMRATIPVPQAISITRSPGFGSASSIRIGRPRGDRFSPADVRQEGLKATSDPERSSPFRYPSHAQGSWAPKTLNLGPKRYNCALSTSKG